MTQLDRIEDRQIDMDRRLRKIENELSEMRGEKRAAKVIKQAAQLVAAAVAGAFGGHLPGAQ